MHNGAERKAALLNKLAERLSPDDLAQIAAEKLSVEDIQALQKEAVGPHGFDVESGMPGLRPPSSLTSGPGPGAMPGYAAASDILSSIVRGGKYVLDPHALKGTGDVARMLGPHAIAAGEGVPASALSRAGQAVGHVGGALGRHPGATAAALASPFVLKWLYDRLTGPDTADHEQKLSAAGFTPQVRADLEKIAADPEVALAVVILGRRGLLG